MMSFDNRRPRPGCSAHGKVLPYLALITFRCTATIAGSTPAEFSRLSRVSILAAIGGALVLGAGAARGGIYAAQRRLMYFPDQHVPDPSSAGVPGAQVGHIHTADGLTLLAWDAPPAAAGNFVVLYLHGNAGNISYRAPRLAALAEFGWGVMLPGISRLWR